MIGHRTPQGKKCLFLPLPWGKDVEDQKQAELVNRVEVVVVEEPHIRIGMQQVYDMVLRVAEGNQRLEAKMDTSLSNQTIQMSNLASAIVRVEAERAKDNVEFRQEFDRMSERLRIVELSPKVTPSGMQWTVGALLSVVAVGVAILALVLR